MVDLDDSLAGVLGGRAASALERAFGYRRVGELLRHYPRRYAERGELTPLDELRIDEQVTVLAEVAKVSRRPTRQRRGSMLEVTVTDGRSSLSLTFFNQAWRERDLRPGRRGLFAGKVSQFRGRRQLTHPDYLLLDDAADPTEAAAFVGALIPVYPATGTLPTWQVARCVRQALAVLDPPEDPLPEPLRRRERLPSLAEALVAVHAPESRPAAERASTRLRWDEAMVLQTALARRRAAAAADPAVPRRPRPGGLLAGFDAALPFRLTAGQREVGEAILADLARPHPMHRLLQGEVGSGKTVVAVRAMLAVVDAGGQAALLAPTEVLATQHHRTVTAMLGPLSTGVALLTGAQGAAARRRALAEAASGEAGIVVGTHALLQEDVSFADLGLVVVDEQHRFGVEQRDALRAKGGSPPHVLVMTATPIPRTVAMTVYGDLETSALTELPEGRQPIATHVVPAGNPAWTERMWARVREEVAAGHQAYVVCPRIGDGEAEEPTEPPPEDAGEDESAPVAGVLETAAALAAGPLAGLRVGLLHGRLGTEEKDRAMTGFARAELDVLVATTVVEVGVDVPNATVMVLLDADRFGVSQLHQLRGRVGRGDAPGVCLLVTRAPADSPAAGRLAAVAATTDGFELARVDLEARREGDVLGAAQSGRRNSLRLLRLLRDEEIIRAAREEATAVVAADPELRGHPGLRRAVDELLAEGRAEYLEKA